MNVNEVLANRASRAPRRAARRRAARASERRRQPRAVVERRVSDGDERRGRRGGRRAICCRRSTRCAATLAAKAAGVRRHRQDRPHAPAGRDAADARPGILRLRGAARAREARTSRRRCRTCASWRSAAPRSAPGSTRIRNSARASRPSSRQLTGLPFVTRAEQVRGAGRARRAGQSARRAEDARRRADEDRQRRALARERAALRPRRDHDSGERAGQLDHAGQGQSDAVRGADDARRRR